MLFVRLNSKVVVFYDDLGRLVEKGEITGSG
jgi:hypothetical protein